MVRRTRNEIVRFYSDDITGRGLTFPQIKPPLRVIYRFSRQKNIGAFMKGLLVKRLESSFYAFRATIERFISSYEKFIEVYDGGAVYIGKGIDVFDLLDDDNFDEINRLLDENRLEKYEAKFFSPDFHAALAHDLQLLRKIAKLWSGISDDPKLDALFEKVLDESARNRTKLIIFTESKETGEYLYNKIEQKYPSKTLCYSSNGGVYANVKYQVKTAREMIRANFDPRASDIADDVLFLLTTDTLAEGVNLHRAGTIVNYDLPWNPTKILQRVGRVNRVGTAHGEISIINFFPTDQSEGEIGLEAAVKAKIQAFHDTLGEDAKYITEEEETGSYGLFGDRHYETVNDAKSYEGERDENDRSELEFLKIIRDVRDNAPQLFERISKIPTKARSGILKDEQKLLTFFRKGGLKKFFVAQNNHESSELTFLEAVELLRCEADEKRPNIPDEKFYELLAKNKLRFDSADETPPATRKGTQNERAAIAHIKAVMDEAKSSEVIKAIEHLDMRRFFQTQQDKTHLFENTEIGVNFVPKIDGFRVKNFKALKDVTLGKLWNEQKNLPLTSMTAVIGKNGAGKSSLFDAFGFLADCLKFGVEEACDANGRGGFDRILSKGQGKFIEFEIYYKERDKTRPITYELIIGLDENNRPYVKKERLRQRRSGQKHGYPFLYLDLENGRGVAWKGGGFQESEGELKLSDLIKIESDKKEMVKLADNRKLGIATLGSLKQHPKTRVFTNL